MTRAETVELALIAATSAALFFTFGSRSWTVGVGPAVAYGAALLLGQGLVRDVARLLLRRERSQATRKVGCLCAESSIGLVFVVLGLAATAVGLEDTVRFGSVGLTATAAAILVFGFFAKDYVIVVRKEKDHASIIVW